MMRLAKFLAKLLVILVALVSSLIYGCNAMNRSARYQCEQERSPTGQYIGEACFLPREYGALFRLYEARTGELLAERTYIEPEPHKNVIWNPIFVQYDLGATENNGVVDLPPTWLDRVRAKLP
ncbi:hypothetical protein [Cupriavidus basilensis]